MQLVLELTHLGHEGGDLSPDDAQLERTRIESAKTLRTSRAQPLDQAVHAAGLRDVLDLQVAGDDRPVAE